MTRPTVRFVPVKSREQQAALSMRRACDLLVMQRTQSVNLMHRLLAEFGINIPEGIEIAGGRAEIRKALYMATLFATRWNPVISVHYKALIERGRPKESRL